ncbi:MAG: sulfotransferase domain-containing protein [Verrucomicrobiota bacterium]
MPLRLNLSSRAARLSGGNAIVISTPNSGRTWIRTFLCAYFCSRFEHPFSLHPDSFEDPRIPRITYTHDLYEHYTKASLWDRLRSKYLVPRSELKRRRILLLTRDPRDAFVSHYHELTRRTMETAGALRNRSVSEILRDPQHGIQLMVRCMNAWMHELGQRPNFTMVRYEDLRAEPVTQFHRVLEGIGETAPAHSPFEKALQLSGFENMRQMEASRVHDPQLLQPGDVQDPESYKVRRGKVGGYVDYLSGNDIEYAESAASRLDVRFGYLTSGRTD